MARSDTRYSIYPAPKAVEVVGNSTPALNQAIECWAALLTRAIADNEKSFSCSYNEHHTAEYHPLHEWRLIAEVLKDRRFDPEYPNPGQLLATAIEDTHRLENIGLDWKDVPDFLAERGPQKEVDTAVKNVCSKLLALDYVHSWALITTVRWFWENHQKGIDIKKDSWWTLLFRRQRGENSDEGSYQTDRGEKPSGKGKAKKKQE
jgi:hypothetical protein